MAVLLGLTGTPLLAQSPFDPEVSPEAANIREEVQLFTDRNLYAVDETIYFVAEYRVSGALESSYWSSVLYVELVGPEGNAAAQGKYLLFGERVEGSLQIPASVLTGNYALKCYTRWMRNQGPASFAYMPLKIVNPFRAEVVAQAGGDLPPAKGSRVPYLEGAMAVAPGSPVYTPGEEGKITLAESLPDELGQLSCCLTVVPAGAIDLEEGQFQQPEEGGQGEDFQVSYLPDLGNGVAISGTVVDASSEPVTYATLHFSLLGDNPDYFATISDEYGRFIFSTPATEGQMELFVTPQKTEGTELEVRIDQEYDTRPLSLALEKFQWLEYEKDLARRISLNVQLSSAYRSPAASLAGQEPASAPASQKNIPFYGTRVKRLLIDDYVRLPNLEEVFINLVPDVQFYKKRGENRIRILSDNASIGIYEPLIMIDHISVFDHEAVLSLSPEKIDRIDLINEVYLKGNVAFGGVLSIYSRQGDLAGIDLPEGSYFFDYQSFYPNKHSWNDSFVSHPENTLGRIPDTRNTIYWTGDLKLEKGTTRDIFFQVPENPGDYVILVRGVDPRGKVHSATAQFRVE